MHMNCYINHDVYNFVFEDCFCPLGRGEEDRVRVRGDEGRKKGEEGKGGERGEKNCVNMGRREMRIIVCALSSEIAGGRQGDGNGR